VGVVFVAAPPGENSKGRKKRHRELRVALAERASFTDPALATFFDRVLGNLPLSVTLCGQMFRAEQSRIGSVAALIAEIEAISVDELSVKGRNAQTDTHYYGLARTVEFAVKRLEAAVGVAPAAKEAAVALLAVLSRLPTDGAAAAELFKVPDDASDAVMDEFAMVAPGESPPPSTVVDLFRESAWSVAFVPACTLLARYGLVRGGASADQPLGSMHQMVQRCVREQRGAATGGIGTMGAADGSDVGADGGVRARTTADVVSWARAVLVTRSTRQWSEMDWPAERRGGDGRAMRALDVCVEMWCRWAMQGLVVAHKIARVGAVTQPRPAVDGSALSCGGRPMTDGAVASARADAWLLNNLALTYSVLGRLDDALKLKQETLAFQKLVLCENHPDIGTSMGNLALTYRAFGRFDKALQLEQETLELRQRVLPDNHPDIATSMGNLASTYGVLGRHDEALQLEEATLTFRQRWLPENDPDIGTSMGNIALTYRALGRHDEALQLQNKALVLQQRWLPENHLDIGSSMCNLALIHNSLGQHNEALELNKKTLELRQRELPENHPDIGRSMGNLAHTHGALGRHSKALQLQKETLAFRQRVLPENHPDIAKSMRNFAIALVNVGRSREAEPHLKNALLILFKCFDMQHPDVLQCKADLKLVRRLLAEPTSNPAQTARRQGAPAGGKGGAARKTKPNDTCPCGTGKKYRKCCMHAAV
jgi:tetratricopeptide (TPR) repeat protein